MVGRVLPPNLILTGNGQVSICLQLPTLFFLYSEAPGLHLPSHCDKQYKVLQQGKESRPAPFPGPAPSPFIPVLQLDSLIMLTGAKKARK